MAYDRFLRVNILVAVSLLAIGCDRMSRGDRADLSKHDPPTQEQPAGDDLGDAKRLFDAGEFDAAAESAYKALVEDPENADATLLASEIEAARGNHQISADLAGSIDLQSRLGTQALVIQYQQLMKLRRISAAADVILAGVAVSPNAFPWRHRAWQLLNRVGRRQEASTQADFLCRGGEATEQELLSLVRRGDSFPFRLAKGEDPRAFFEPGLGMARWYFTNQEYDKALDELSTQVESGFQTPAAAALYGRLLAETQRLEAIPTWYATCGTKVSSHADYWAALGAYFIERHQFEASARAFLEAVFRDPTDRSSAQRLAMVFDSLEQPDQGTKFRDRAIELRKSHEDSETLAETPSDSLTRKRLTQSLLKLGRPYETIGWTLLILPTEAVAERTEMTRKLAELNSDAAVTMMPAISSLVGIDPDQLKIEPAMQILRSAAPIVEIHPSEAELLARPRFVNVAAEVGVEFQWYADVEIDFSAIPIHESVGGGIAVLDYDLDGWPDIYLAQGSGDPPTDHCTRSNILLRNVGAKYQPVDSLAGASDTNYSTGLAAGDVNQDGFPDLYLGSAGHNRLLINNGDGTFRDATDRMGRFEDRFSSSLAIADINGDGLPDLFEGNYIEMEGAFALPEVDKDGTVYVPAPLLHQPDADRWFENLGDGDFRIHEITREVAKPGSSLGVMITDFDSNGRNEVFVGNDLRPNHFLIQGEANSFRNAADVMGVASGFSGKPNGCMGIAHGDFNRDGQLDLHITNFFGESANLYLHTTSRTSVQDQEKASRTSVQDQEKTVQASSGGFTDYAIRYGLDSLSNPLVGFGTKAIDVDRNGWLDLVVTNGHIFDLRHAGHAFEMPPQVLMSLGNRFELTEVDDDSGYWTQDYLGRSMASLDFDRDGTIDLLIGHLDQPLALLRNETQSRGKWIQFELIGTVSERDAVGARVVVTAGGQRFTHWVTAGDGYFCSDEPVVDFGVGTADKITEVEVSWPSGNHQAFENAKPNHRYLIVEGDRVMHVRN